MTDGLTLMNMAEGLRSNWEEINSDDNDIYHKLLLEKRFPIKETDNSYRIINHWCEKNLLEDIRENGSSQWRKFSLSDIVWVNIITELRQFGLSLDKMQKVKEELEIYPKKFKISYFHVHIIQAISGALSEVVVYTDGSAGICRDSGINLAIQHDKYPSHIIINLNKIIDRLLNRKTLKNSKPLVTFTTKEEQKIINKLRLASDVTSGTKKVSIKYKNNKISRIESEKDIDIEKRLIEILRENNYQTITIQQEGGKIVKIDQTVKEKI